MPDPHEHSVDPTDSSDVLLFPIAEITNPGDYGFTVRATAADIEGDGGDTYLEMDVPARSTAYLGARLRFGPDSPMSPLHIEKKTVAPVSDVESDVLAIDISLDTIGAGGFPYGFSIVGAIADNSTPDAPVSDETETAWIEDIFQTRTTWSITVGLRSGEDFLGGDPQSDERLPSEPAGSDPDASFDWETIRPRLSVEYALGAERLVLMQSTLAADASSPPEPGSSRGYPDLSIEESQSAIPINRFMPISYRSFYEEVQYLRDGDELGSSTSPPAQVDLRLGASHPFSRRFSDLDLSYSERNETDELRPDVDWSTSAARSASADGGPDITPPVAAPSVAQTPDITATDIEVQKSRTAWYRDIKVLAAGTITAAAIAGAGIWISTTGDEQTTPDDPSVMIITDSITDDEQAPDENVTNDPTDDEAPTDSAGQETNVETGNEEVANSSGSADDDPPPDETGPMGQLEILEIEGFARDNGFGIVVKFNLAIFGPAVHRVDVELGVDNSEANTTTRYSRIDGEIVVDTINRETGGVFPLSSSISTSEDTFTIDATYPPEWPVDPDNDTFNMKIEYQPDPAEDVYSVDSGEHTFREDP